MINVDGKIASEIVVEKTEEELASALRGYEAKPFAWWRIVLSFLVLVAIGVMFIQFGKNNKTTTKVVSSLMDPFAMMLEEEPEDNDAQREFESNPTHKGYFLQYVLDIWNDEGADIQELMTIADDIDPNNGLYHYMAAGLKEREVIEKQRLLDDSGLIEREKMNLVTEYKVLDEETYAKALEHIIVAGKREGIIDHSFELRMKKIEDAKARIPQDYLGRLVMAFEAFDVKFFSMNLLGASDILAAKFYQLSQNGTKEEVELWKNEYLKFIDSQIKSQRSLVDVLVIEATLRTPLTNMRAAAAHVGMVEDVERITSLLDKYATEKEARIAEENAAKVSTDDGSTYSRFSFIKQYSDLPIRRRLKTDAALNIDENPAPGRLAEHALTGRILVFITVICIGILCIGFWIYYWNKSKQIRTLGLQMLSSLKFSDTFIIVFCGVISPLIFYIIINEKTPLGVREWGVNAANFMLVPIQFCGILLTIFTLTSALLRSRLTKSLPDLVKPTQFYQWCLPAISLITVLLVGLSDSNAGTLSWTFSLLLLAVVALTWMGASATYCFIHSNRVEKVAICRGNLSLFAVIMIIMSALSLYYHAQEFAYVKQDEGFSFKEEHWGLSQIEYHVSKERGKELLKDLEIIR